MAGFCENLNNDPSYINPKRLFCNYFVGSKRSEGIRELQKEILESNSPTKKNMEKYRNELTEVERKQYKNCKDYCTEYAERNGLKFPLCSNAGESYESCCHLSCDKEFVSPILDAEFVGRCDDPRKYPMQSDGKNRWESWETYGCNDYNASSNKELQLFLRKEY